MMANQTPSKLTRLTLNLDPDDARDINRAIATYQKRTRWPKSQGGGVLLPEGDSDLPGAILGEICRAWLDEYGE